MAKKNGVVAGRKETTRCDIEKEIYTLLRFWLEPRLQVLRMSNTMTDCQSF